MNEKHRINKALTISCCVAASSNKVVKSFALDAAYHNR